MQSGKASILAAIAKLDRPFRAATIGQMTGLDRQLVHYHLTIFCENGWLIKEGRTYQVENLEHIIDALLETTESNSVGSGKPSFVPCGFINAQAYQVWVDIAQGITYAKSLKAPYAIEMNIHFIKQIDAMVAGMKSLRRYLNNAQPTPRASAKYFQRHHTLWEMMESLDMQMPLNSAAWKSQVAMLVESALSE